MVGIIPDGRAGIPSGGAYSIQTADYTLDASGNLSATAYPTGLNYAAAIWSESGKVAKNNTAKTFTVASGTSSGVVTVTFLGLVGRRTAGA